MDFRSEPRWPTPEVPSGHRAGAPPTLPRKSGRKAGSIAAVPGACWRQDNNLPLSQWVVLKYLFNICLEERLSPRNKIRKGPTGEKVLRRESQPVPHLQEIRFWPQICSPPPLQNRSPTVKGTHLSQKTLSRTGPSEPLIQVCLPFPPAIFPQGRSGKDCCLSVLLLFSVMLQLLGCPPSLPPLRRPGLKGNVVSFQVHWEA